jgi:hypothetical protein
MIYQMLAEYLSFALVFLKMKWIEINKIHKEFIYHTCVVLFYLMLETACSIYIFCIHKQFINVVNSAAYGLNWQMKIS